MQEEKLTLYELLAGIVFFLLLFMLGNFLLPEKLPYTTGVLLGGLIAVVMVCHMYSSLQKASLFDEETASKKVKISSLFRMLFMLAGLVAAIIVSEYISFIGMALGILSLKFSAYLQPLTHKVISKFINKGR